MRASRSGWPQHGVFRIPAENRPTQPDIPFYSRMDYGSRVGFCRMLDVLNKHKLRACCCLSFEIFDHFPEIKDAMIAADWDYMAHGLYNSRPIYELYEEPASIFVAGFIGAPMMNFVPARVAAEGGGPALVLEDGVRLPGPPGLEIGHLFTLGLRPEHFEWRPGATGPGSLQVTARVIEPLGADTLVFFELGGHEAVCRVPPRTVRRPGKRFTLFVDAARPHLLDPVTERAIHPAPDGRRVAGAGAAMIPLRASGEAAGRGSEI